MLNDSPLRTRLSALTFSTPPVWPLHSILLHGYDMKSRDKARVKRINDRQAFVWAVRKCKGGMRRKPLGSKVWLTNSCPGKFWQTSKSPRGQINGQHRITACEQQPHKLIPGCFILTNTSGLSNGQVFQKGTLSKGSPVWVGMQAWNLASWHRGVGHSEPKLSEGLKHRVCTHWKAQARGCSCALLVFRKISPRKCPLSICPGFHSPRVPHTKWSNSQKTVQTSEDQV